MMQIVVEWAIYRALQRGARKNAPNPPHLLSNVMCSSRLAVVAESSCRLLFGRRGWRLGTGTFSGAWLLCTLTLSVGFG